MNIPPHNEKAESAVIGIVLKKQDLLIEIDLTPEVFYSRQNQEIWTAIQEMSMKGEAIDHITVAKHLTGTDRAFVPEIIDKFIELNDESHITQNIGDYCDILRESHQCRREIEILSDAEAKAYDGESVASDVISSLTSIEAAECNMSDSIIYDHWERALDGRIVTIPTPFDSLNQVIGGVKQGLHTILCGRGGSGKSMLMAQWYVHLGKLGIPALVMPFEDKYEITKTRMAANLGRYKWHKIQYGGERVNINGGSEWLKVTRKELDFAKECMERITDMPIHFSPQRISLKGLRSKIVRAKSRHGVRIVFIDGAKDIRRPSGKYNDTGYDEEISQEICSIAEDEQVAIVSVFHLTKIPSHELITEGNIRGSGQIVNDARCVMALQSNGLKEAGVAVNYDDRGNQTTRTVEVIKSNHSRCGSVLVETDLAKIQFWEGV